jgi:dual specificity protein kinase YAK1
MGSLRGLDSLELNNRASFIDFCQGLLNLNPIERWSPQQARLHPFITGEKFTKPFVVSHNDS